MIFPLYFQTLLHLDQIFQRLLTFLKDPLLWSTLQQGELGKSCNRSSELNNHLIGILTPHGREEG